MNRVITSIAMSPLQCRTTWAKRVKASFRQTEKLSIRATLGALSSGVARFVVMMPTRLTQTMLVVVFVLAAKNSCAQSGSAEIAFTRIIPGWTNYSTAFLATHDTGGSDYST